MKKFTGLALIIIIFSSCDVQQKKEAKLPEIEVDVDTESGQLPTYDIEWADVNVGTRTETVEIPKVVIVMEEEEVEIPYVDVDMPNKDKEEMTLMVEAEVTENEHAIDIKEIVATDNNLYVISELKSMDQTIGDKKMRVSDQVVLNAPNDLNVKYIIVGERPDRVFNKRYKYVKDMNAFKEGLKNAKVIFTK